MKNLTRRLSQVADSSTYSVLRYETKDGSKKRRRGTVPVSVGEEMERFFVPAELVNHPIFAELLNRSAQEYGYQQKGVLRIPCHVIVFERVLEALRVGDGSVFDLVAALYKD